MGYYTKCISRKSPAQTLCSDSYPIYSILSSHANFHAKCSFRYSYGLMQVLTPVRSPPKKKAIQHPGTLSLELKVFLRTLIDHAKLMELATMWTILCEGGFFSTELSALPIPSAGSMGLSTFSEEQLSKNTARITVFFFFVAI